MISFILEQTFLFRRIPLGGFFEHRGVDEGDDGVFAVEEVNDGEDLNAGILPVFGFVLPGGGGFGDYVLRGGGQRDEDADRAFSRLMTPTKSLIMPTLTLSPPLTEMRARSVVLPSGLK